MFKEVGPTVDFPRMESRILEFWMKNDSFKKRVAINKGKKKWSFIDGPITANNPMGVHHAWGRTYKDLFQRYKAIRGYDLRYQNGFDCQGLWIEVEVERELKFKTKRDIEKYGIANFVKRCKQRALRYAAVQVEQSRRLGYWMDWDHSDILRYLAKKLENPQQVITIDAFANHITDTVEKIVGRLGDSDIGGSYFTLSDENNYMIWTVLKKCYERGWIYRGTDVMPWCPRCSTSISQHEIVTEGYKEIIHPALVVKFPLKDKKNESLLIWTTTPWTLTSNVVAAVHPGMIYVKVNYEGEVLYLAKLTLQRIFPNQDYEVIEEFKGKDMVEWRYKGPYDELSAPKSIGAVEAHKVIFWDEVSEKEGTGIVHIAPGCGREDLELARHYELPVVAPLDEYGIFKDGYGWLTGVHVYSSNKRIIEDLKKKSLLFKVENYTHRYPVCWRCGNELVFRLVDEWFISMGEKLDKPINEVDDEEKIENLRYQIIESAKRVKWIPFFGLQQELDWLQNMEDWMISKKRYWGLALPIWTCPKCKNFEVIGDKEELKSRAIEGWEIFDGHSPHRPWIDAVKIKCFRCGAKASRIPDVGNPWLDAGIVAYSTLRYRKDRKYWRMWFPANFICESLPGQFRNWFYSMLVMSTILEKCTSFKVCFGHGLVLGEDGREMHKSWGNAIWFDDAVETMGADVMRWMYSTNRHEADLLFGYGRANEVKRRFFIPLWNIYSFFVTYANLDRWTPKDSVAERSPLDRWIISRLQVLIKAVTRYLDDYDPYNASIRIEEFVNELSTQYIRRSRRRFWKSEGDVDKKGAYTTLYTCLTTLIKLLAPFVPFITEEMYQNIVRLADPKAAESIHHNEWPDPNERIINQELMDSMNIVIKVCSLGRSARSKARIKLRQPLSQMKVVADRDVLSHIKGLKWIIRDELNVEELILTGKREELFDCKIKPIPEAVGRKYGHLFPKIRRTIGAMDQEKLALPIKKGLPIELMVEGRKVGLSPNEVKVEFVVKKDYSVVEEDGMIIGINTLITDELKKSGLARDVVRRIQNQRKEAGFKISDWIETYYKASPRLSEVFKEFGDYIASETLSLHLHEDAPPDGAHIADYKIEGEYLRAGLILSKSN